MIKHIPNLDPTRPIQTQVQVVNLPGSAPNKPGSFAVNPYEAIHSYIHLVVAPYFDAYVNEKGVNTEANTIGKKHDDSKMGIPMTKKKIAELELSLLYLQQNVVIPEVFLNVHPIVQRAVENRDVMVSARNGFTWFGSVWFCGTVQTVQTVYS